MPPVAKTIPVQSTLHGAARVDPYAWLRNRDDPDTIAYLEAENAHTEEETRHLEPLRDAIFGEIKARTQETDLSAPARRGDWWYASRTEEGKQYPIMVRRAGGPEGPEQVLLDLNVVAEGHEYVQLGVFTVSPDHSRLAWSIDTDGSELFDMRIRDLDSGADLDDLLARTYYSAAWSSDSTRLFYTTVDAAHRPDRVWRHSVGAAQSDDVEVFHEADERMFVGVGTTQDDTYLVVTTGSQVTAGAYVLRSGQPDGGFEPVLPIIHGIQYSVDHKDGRWIVVTEDRAPNGRLLSISVDDPDDVEELIPHDPEKKVVAAMAFAGHIVVGGRTDALTSITILPDSGEAYVLPFEEPVYTVGPGRNLEYHTSVLRVAFQSLTTPPQVIDIDLATGQRTLVKETPVLGGYDPADYEAWRDWATAPDGTRIPVSLVRKRTTATPAPTLLYAYGSYEIPTDPWFSVARLSLLDRGAVFAVAHIRGGGELGKPWYHAGKLEQKQNTFSDFIAVADHLIETRVTSPDRLAARGGSAGGLLMGAVATQAPDRFAAVVAEVPFVDVINTMLDASLPLTVIEWEEWGDPRRPEDFAWMKAYSPYDNVTDQEYPAMLVTAGLNDPRVAYWEPAKWVAKLRAGARTRGPLLLKTEMGAGHAGPTGRYRMWRDEAFVLSFVLDQIARP